METLMTVKEIARELKVSNTVARRWAWKGVIQTDDRRSLSQRLYCLRLVRGQLHDKNIIRIF